MPNGPIPPGPAQAKTALQNITDRIRRAFGAAGTVSPSLKYEVQLSADVADLTEPGNSPYRGRYFAVGIGTQNAAVGNTSWAFSNRDQVVLLGFFYSSVGGAGDITEIFLLDPTTVPTNVPATLAGGWSDQKANTGDRPPLVDNNNLWLADAAAYGSANRIASLNGQAAGHIVAPLWVHMVTGSTLVVRNNLGATKPIGITFYGKVF